MYFSRSLVLAILPFFAAAIPLAQLSTSRGIAIPITKHVGATAANRSSYVSRVQSSIA